MCLVLALLLPLAFAGEVRRRALLALGLDHAVLEELADRQREVLGRGAELLVDLLDAQSGILADELDERIRELLDSSAVRFAPRPRRGRSELAA
jgi:hypothetical protein